MANGGWKPVLCSANGKYWKRRVACLMEPEACGEEQLEFDAPMKVASTGKTKRLRGRALAPKPKP
eukprot:scaffold114389_cov32-Tisochrysis_lutea.AAC.2